MKIILYMLPFLFFVQNTQAQNYTETFPTNSKGITGACSGNSPSDCTANLSGVDWTVSGNLSVLMPDPLDYFEVRNGQLELSIVPPNVGNTDEVCYQSPLIDISTGTTSDISVFLDWTSFAYRAGGDSEHIAVRYTVDGVLNEIPNILAGSTANHTVEYDATTAANDPSGTGSGNATVTGITGNTLQIEVCINVSNFNDIVKIDDISVINQVALAVELSDFKANHIANTVELSWATFSETNNDYFSIQKSTNGKNFQEIAVERGAGTANESQFYNYTDERPVNGINYYRLQQGIVTGYV